MSGRDLIKLILDKDAEDCRVAVGCQGYVSADGSDDTIRLKKRDGVMYLLDSCVYEGIDC